MQGFGTSRFNRRVPPADYLFKIKSYSLLVESKEEKFESNYFEAGGHNWKLILYPKGNSKKSNGKDHVSLYLAIVDTENFKSGWEVNINFKLFVYDQINDNYLTIQDANGTVQKFREGKTEWGFDQLISLQELKNKSKGYLVKDLCIFGAEIFVIRHSGKWESLTMVKDPSPASITWKLKNFSKLDKDFLYSPSTTVGGREWKLKLYPKGVESVRGKYLSLFLHLADCEKFPSIRTVYASSKKKILDQLNQRDKIKGSTDPVIYNASDDEWGYDKFISLSKLNEADNGYIKDDVIIIEVQFYSISMISS